MSTDNTKDIAGQSATAYRICQNWQREQHQPGQPKLKKKPTKTKLTKTNENYQFETNQNQPKGTFRVKK